MIFRIALAIVGVTVLLQSPATAQSVEEFYKAGRSTCSSAAARAAATTSITARSARHIGKHIPGHPDDHSDATSRRRPGLRRRPRSTPPSTRTARPSAAFPNNVPMDPLFGNPGARYDALKLNWIGSIGKLQNVCATWHTSPIKTIAAGARARGDRGGGRGADQHCDHAARAQCAARHEVQADHRLRPWRRA